MTRAALLRLAAGEGLPVVERAPLLAEREEWQEAFLCGTLTGVQPLVTLDGAPLAAGGSDPWTRRLALALDRYEQELVAAAGSCSGPGRPLPACHIPAISRPDPSPPQPSRRPAAALD